MQTKLISRASNLFERVASVIVILGVICLITLTLVLFSLSSTHMAVTSQQIPNQFYQSISDLTLQILGIETSSLQPDQYKSHLSSILNTGIVVIAIWYALLPLIGYLRYKTRLKRGQSFKVHPVFKDGVDDLKIMLQYYKGAEQIIVFAGDFDWVASNQSLRKEICRLAKRQSITLVSNKSQEIVKTSLGNSLFGELHGSLLFDKKVDIQCSFVKQSGGCFFLYKHRYPEFEETDINICVLSERPESRYLLEAIEQLSLLGAHKT